MLGGLQRSGGGVLVDELSVYLNRLFSRIHPWHPIAFESVHESHGGLRLRIGSVAAIVFWEMGLLEYRLRCPTLQCPQRMAFIQRINDIMDGKVRDADGNMVDAPHNTATR